MKTTKRIISLALSAALMLTLIPATSLASTTLIGGGDSDTLNDGEIISGDYIYSILNDKATISRYIGNATTVKVPGTLGGYPVTDIDVGAFRRYTYNYS